MYRITNEITDETFFLEARERKRNEVFRKKPLIKKFLPSAGLCIWDDDIAQEKLRISRLRTRTFLPVLILIVFAIP